MFCLIVHEQHMICVSTCVQCVFVATLVVVGDVKLVYCSQRTYETRIHLEVFTVKKVPLTMDGVIFSIFMLGTDTCIFSVPFVRIGLSPLPGVPEVFLHMWYHFQAQDLQLIPRGDDVVEMVALGLGSSMETNDPVIYIDQRISDFQRSPNNSTW